MSDNTCNTCALAYDFTKKSAVVCMFPDVICNHVAATCPTGHTERVYVTWKLLHQLIVARQIPVRVSETTPAELLAAARKAWEIDVTPETEPPALIKEPWRSPRKNQDIENQARFFRLLLDRGEMP